MSDFEKMLDELLLRNADYVLGVSDEATTAYLQSRQALIDRNQRLEDEKNSLQRELDKYFNELIELKQNIAQHALEDKDE